MNHLIGFMQSFLANSLWQVPMLFGIAWIVARLLPAGETALRHRVWAGALLLQCVLPAGHFPGSLHFDLLRYLHSGNAASSGVSVEIGQGVVQQGMHLWPLLLLAVMCLYVLTIAVAATRLAWRYRQVVMLRSTATLLTFEPQDADVFAEYCKQLALPLVPVTVSARVFGPSTIGVRNRLVLLPQILATDASQDRHAALAHELAHVQRRDFAKNLLYEFLSLAIAYHPCLWVTRARLTESREMVCDTTAACLLSGSQGRQAYAHSLLRLAAQLTAPPRTTHSHAIGMFDSSSFERRIMQISTQTEIVRGVRRAWMLGAIGAVALLTCGSALALGTNGTPDLALPAAQPAAAQRPLSISPGVMAGQVLHKVAPVYPPEAKEAKIQGSVVLHGIVGKDGTVQSLQVKSGPTELARSALDAVRQWTYKPFLLNGEPTEVETDITITYSLQN